MRDAHRDCLEGLYLDYFAARHRARSHFKLDEEWDRLRGEVEYHETRLREHLLALEARSYYER